jgi:hypothetical protein
MTGSGAKGFNIYFVVPKLTACIIVSERESVAEESPESLPFRRRGREISRMFAVGDMNDGEAFSLKDIS